MKYGIRYSKLWKHLKKNNFLSKFYHVLFSEKIEKHREKTFSDNSLKILFLTMKVFKENNLKGFPAFGTLLGLIREGNLLKHDLDFGIVVNEKFTWKKVIDSFEGNGFVFSHSFSHDGIVREMTFYSPISRYITVDFFAFVEDNGCFSKYGYIQNPDGENYLVAQERLPYFSDFNEVTIAGVNVSVPSNSEELLEATYTKNWKQPNPSWGYDEKPNRRILEQVYGRISYEK